MSTSIEWTDETWNPTGGCERISPGCAHCYAKTQWDMRHKAHLSGKKMAAQYAQPFEVLQLFEDRLLEPLSWRRPRRVFVNSVSDLFHEDVPDAFIDRVFAVMSLTPWNTYQILTKRADRMRAYMAALTLARLLPWINDHGPDGTPTMTETPAGGFVRSGVENLCTVARRVKERVYRLNPDEMPLRTLWPLPNVWLGVSVENPPFLTRIDELLQIQAAVHFVSLEPLLADLGDISRWLKRGSQCDCGTLRGTDDGCEPRRQMIRCNAGLRRLSWVIVGGESGPGARPFDLAWARSIVQQCKAAGVPVFVKQVGPIPHVVCPSCNGAGSADVRSDAYCGRCIGCHRQTYFGVTDRKGGNPDEWPVDLRVREWPEVRA